MVSPSVCLGQPQIDRTQRIDSNNGRELMTRWIWKCLPKSEWNKVLYPLRLSTCSIGYSTLGCGLKCQFGCGRYGKSTVVRQKHLRLLRMQSVIDCLHERPAHSLPGEGQSYENRGSSWERNFSIGYYKALGLVQALQALVKSARSRMPALPNWHARNGGLWIDVYATAHNNAIPLTVLTNKSCEGNYFGLGLNRNDKNVGRPVHQFSASRDNLTLHCAILSGVA